VGLFVCFLIGTHELAAARFFGSEKSAEETTERYYLGEARSDSADIMEHYRKPCAVAFSHRLFFPIMTVALC
jgi:hypothetical protein